MKIYTRGGDAGETGLLGGDRVPKDHPAVAAYGAVDELNSALGFVLAADDAAEGWLEEEREALRAVQEDLFTIGARLAAADPERALEKGTIPSLAPDRTAALEEWIDAMDEDLPELDAFVLPGGCLTAAGLHVARTACRRAERAVVPLAEEAPGLREVTLPYLNRLSDLLFTLARWVNLRAGIPDETWLPQRRRGREP